MVHHPSVRVQQAGKARFVYANGADLGNQRIAGNIHAQHADHGPSLIDGHQIRINPHFIQEMGGIRPHPGGPPPLDGRIIPCGVGYVLRIQLPGVQGFLPVKARFAHLGIKETVFCFADLRIDAVVIGDDAVGMAGDGGEGRLQLGAVPAQIFVQPNDLVVGALRLAGRRARRAVLQ